MPRLFARRILPLALAALLATAGPAMSCPNCKEALASQDGEAARLQDGYSTSILFMMAMPLALFGAGAFFLVRAARRGQLPQL